MTSSTQANLRQPTARTRRALALACLLCACGPGRAAIQPAPDPAPAARRAPAATHPLDTDDPAGEYAQTQSAQCARAGAAAPDALGSEPAPAAALGLDVKLRPSGLAFELSAAQDAPAQQLLKSLHSVEVRIEGAQHTHTSVLPVDSAGSSALRTLGGDALPDGHYSYEVAPRLPLISGAAPQRAAATDSYARRPLREALRARAGAVGDSSAEPVLDLDGRNALDPRIAARKAAPALPKVRGSFSIFHGALALDEAEPGAPPQSTSQAAPLHR